MDTNRKTAYLALMDVESKKSYSNIALNHQIIRNRPASQGFVRELVYGVLENKLLLDYYVDQLVTSGAASLRNSDRTVLRMGIYQLAFMDSVPEYAAVNESVVLAKRYCRGRDGFINGVLRNYLNRQLSIKLPDRAEDLVNYFSVKYSCAPWIIELWLEQYTVDFVEEMLKANNRTPDMTIRLNWLKIRKKDLIQKLEERGFEVTEGDLCENALHVKGEGLLSSELYEWGLFSVQDESSIMAAEKLNPQKGDCIIDVCAAPGGKTLAIAERMNNQGKILAMDIYRRKLDIIDKEAKRLGVANIETRSWDGTKVNSSLVEKADKVLVDAPCSGLGVVRRKPEIKYKERTAEMDLLPKKQLAILSASAEYVKPGGTLVYSTCTINPYENQRVVAAFLKKHPLFEKEEAVQLMPHVNGTDGFFICVMKKSSSLV